MVHAAVVLLVAAIFISVWVQGARLVTAMLIPDPRLSILLSYHGHVRLGTGRLEALGTVLQLGHTLWGILFAPTSDTLEILVVLISVGIAGASVGLEVDAGEVWLRLGVGVLAERALVIDDKIGWLRLVEAGVRSGVSILREQLLAVLAFAAICIVELLLQVLLVRLIIDRYLDHLTGFRAIVRRVAGRLRVAILAILAPSTAPILLDEQGRVVLLLNDV